MGFLVSNDLVSSKVDYVELGENNVLVISNEKGREICKKNDLKIKTIVAKFSRPAWGTFNSYMNGTVMNNAETGISSMDSVKLRQQKFRYLLEEIYEVINGEDKKIVLSESLFDNINIDIALSLIGGYDDALDKEREAAIELLGLFDEEEKKEEDKDEKKEEDKDEKEKTKTEESVDVEMSE